MEVVTTAILENLVSIVMATLSGLGGLMIYLLIRKLNPDVAEKAVLKAFNKHTHKAIKYEEKSFREKEKAMELEPKIKDKTKESIMANKIMPKTYTETEVEEMLKKVAGVEEK